uniref:Uncharacterized protein n=1 Tax=Anguilla anguilla TaxID=7936 RepID=A0A0E9XSP3_ANGAN
MLTKCTKEKKGKEKRKSKSLISMWKDQKHQTGLIMLVSDESLEREGNQGLEEQLTFIQAL